MLMGFSPLVNVGGGGSSGTKYKSSICVFDTKDNFKFLVEMQVKCVPCQGAKRD